MPTVYKVVQLIHGLLRSARVPLNDPSSFYYQPLTPLTCTPGQPLFGFESIATARRWMERDRDQRSWHNFRLWEAHVPKIIPVSEFVSGYAFSPYIEDYWNGKCKQPLGAPNGSVLCQQIELLHDVTPIYWSENYNGLKVTRLTELRALPDRNVPQFDYGFCMLSIDDLIDEIGRNSFIGQYDIEQCAKAKL